MPGKKKSKSSRQRKEKLEVVRELPTKGHGQEYAQVTKLLGNCRFEALCFDGKTRLVHIRGKMRKRSWLTVSDVILIGLRDFQDDKADVILKYSAAEVHSLKALGEVPETTEVRDRSIFADDDASVEQEENESEVIFDEI